MRAVQSFIIANIESGADLEMLKGGVLIVHVQGRRKQLVVALA